MKPNNWFMSLTDCEVGDYVLKQYIGCGKIGYVYRALSKEVKEWEVAVKLIPGRPRPGLENELRKVSRLSTIQGVVHLHNQGVDKIRRQGRTEIFQYTVWDYIRPGRNLRNYLANCTSCPTSFLLAVIEQVLRVLHACQTKGIPRHGDLHAGNILIGEKDEADLDSALQLREPIYVSDFGYGTTGGKKRPKDDYLGLAEIANTIIAKVEWDAASVTDRQMLGVIRNVVNKLLKEASVSERQKPLGILQSIRDSKSRTGAWLKAPTQRFQEPESSETSDRDTMKVGQFQVSEMLGDEWKWWKKLFVSTVPARSRILEPDISTVVTGPRGCGKTMLFRRLSERLIVECGPVEDLTGASNFTGLYVNANDIADAFSSFPESPSQAEGDRLICYANLCILSDLLAVQYARFVKHEEAPSDELLACLKEWLVGDMESQPLVVGENPLERYRSVLEQIKWRFQRHFASDLFPGFVDMSQHIWLRRLVPLARQMMPWIGSKTVFIFIDDYSTPRVSVSMQRVLNRMFFQRSSEFVCKVATESATTFVEEDSSEKKLQAGDDYQLIDMGEESLFMKEEDRSNFLDELFRRRLSLDPRVNSECRTLLQLLGNSGKSKTEFARLLRGEGGTQAVASEVAAGSQRRGATKPKVLYHGSDIFTSLWSGDTRTMIQLVQDLLDEAQDQRSFYIKNPVDPELQDRVFRNRGAQWLEAQTRNQPTDPKAAERELEAIRSRNKDFAWVGGSYGSHLKAVVEAFVVAARKLLLGPTYKIREGEGIREVPRMAFRIEIVDDFRIVGLAAEIYKDLIRYGLFMRDARGKSVRGAMVPRLYLRRLLLPYGALAISKRDSVQLNCDSFVHLLLSPDEFKTQVNTKGVQQSIRAVDQLKIPFMHDQNESLEEAGGDLLYNDLSSDEQN